MIKETIRRYLNSRGYEIIKQDYLGDKYPARKEGSALLYETPIGKYWVPDDAEKDGVVDTMARGKMFEPEVAAIAKHYITPGSGVLDVGANFGQMSVYFSQLTGKGGKVYSFEAQDKVFSYLKKNAEANQCDNIVCLDGAVYNEDGKILIFPEPDLAAQNPYGANAINPKLKAGREVKTFTIDSLNIAEKISFMKVDIQGSDLFAMQGAKETILKNKMPILFEFEDQFQEQFGTSFQDYVDFVAQIGYRFDRILMEINYLILPQ